MKTTNFTKEKDWRFIETLLPEDINETARAYKVFVRRRNVPNAIYLLRMFLLYVTYDLSFKDAAALISNSGLSTLSGPSFFERFIASGEWLKLILAQLLQSTIHSAPIGMRLRIVDATVITGPGATGTEYRAHVVFDPFSATITSVDVTDASGGEGLSRHPVDPSELLVGDRAYSTASGIAYVSGLGGYVLTRLNAHTIRICDDQKRVISLLSRESEIPEVGVITYNLLLPIPPKRITATHKTWKLEHAIDWIPVRVMAARTIENKVIWLITTAPEEMLSAEQATEVYRIRWQIELQFKNLKSILNLDQLKSRQGPSAIPWILSKFVAAALMQKLADKDGVLSPYGYQISQDKRRMSSSGIYD